jgi:hypothetical protein
MSTKRPRQKTVMTLERECMVWNVKHPIGTQVEYHSVIGEPAHILTRTRTQAYVLSCHTAVLFVEGIAGCVALDACIPTKPTVERTNAEVSPEPGDTTQKEAK